MKGECARLNRTLEKHCKPDGCRLYYTKRGTTPIEFAGLFEAAIVCRARQKAGLDLTEYPLPFWAEKAHLVSNGVFLQVESMPPPDSDEDMNATGFQIKGSGDSGAFAAIHEALIEARATVKESDG